jgi:hypothetical protein
VDRDKLKMLNKKAKAIDELCAIMSEHSITRIYFEGASGKGKGINLYSKDVIDGVRAYLKQEYCKLIEEFKEL